MEPPQDASGETITEAPQCGESGHNAKGCKGSPVNYAETTSTDIPNVMEPPQAT
ncbi:uncharacterized protein G2W53_041540 [Senna tora]|uniref:Uncharacterized protein n=1 Tax=Senna tora TaxID=362788 RepID=A0A834W302_9FABA|nr:uncharacterized protein G2W53_041540 [Senna tora]